MVMQGLVNTAEVYFVGRLGSTAIAGAALCFPAMMLMSAMSGAGLGGGVSSAIARSVGAGKIDQARSLAIHSILLGLATGLFFTLLMEFAGGPLYRLMGGRDETLAASLAYSTAFFRGVALVWLFNTLASIYRGVGQPAFPALVGAAGGIVIVIASPSMIFGVGPIPALGIAGAGIAVILYVTVGSGVLLARMFGPRSPLHLSLEGFRLNSAHFWEILRVGLPSSANTVVGTLGFMVMTGLVGRFGSNPLAAFGLGTRFEFVLIPVVFGLGTAVLTMVGAAVGAVNYNRAKAVTRAGAVVAGASWGFFGIVLTIFPRLWLGIFTADPQVLALGSRYFRYVGPLYALVGIGMILYFACQGIGQATLPLLVGVGRLAVALILGWAVVSFGGGVESVFAAVAVGLALYGLALMAMIYVIFRRLDREAGHAAQAE
jgi:putative MATE family efflux protein